MLPGFTLGNVRRMHFNENGAGSLDDYIGNRDGCLGSNGVANLHVFAESLQAAVSQGSELLPDASGSDARDSSSNSSTSSQGSSTRMEDINHEWCSDSGWKNRGLSSSSLKALDNVVIHVLESVRAAGYGEEVCKEFREHFARLPAR